MSRAGANACAHLTAGQCRHIVCKSMGVLEDSLPVDRRALGAEAEREVEFCRQQTPRLFHVFAAGQRPRTLLAALKRAGWQQAPPEQASVLLVTGRKDAAELATRTLAEHGNLVGALLWRADKPGTAENIVALDKGLPAAAAPVVLDALIERYCLKKILVLEKAGAREVLQHLSQILSARDEFFSIATHDLRNPLTTLKLSLDLLNLPATEQNQQMLDIIRRNIEKMEALVNDMLEVFRLYRGSFRLNLTDVQINSLVEDSVVSHYPKAVEKEITLDFLLDRRCQPVPADPFRVNQVLANLLSNALKYTPRRGIVEVGTLWQDDGVLIHVRDTGPGVPEAERSRLFESFGRGSARATGDEASTGLGLYICKRIMSLHGGRIWLESAEGGGSTFYAFFPARTTPKAEPPDTNHKEPTVVWHGRPRRPSTPTSGEPGQ